MSARRQFIRDFRAGPNLDLFLVAAVSAVLLIRFFLRVTDYPRIGGDSLHIAHMLWGGLLMMVALVVGLSYLGRRARQAAALLGGIGFGTFIDEVGKFVTRDNDYFYQPAIALIYVVFILTYLAIRMLHRERSATREEYMVNALREMENVVVNELDEEQRARVLTYLERANSVDPLAQALREVLGRIPAPPPPSPHPLARLRRAALRLYRGVIRLPGFPTLVAVFFAAQLALMLLHVGAILIWEDLTVPLTHGLPPTRRVAGAYTFADWALLASSLLSGAFVLLGILRIRGSRLDAFRMFQRSILVSIFLTQVFIFYRDQLSALTVLGFNLLVLLAVSFVIEEESEVEGEPA